MTFYLKYRPQNLDELDLVSVRETLKKIVENKDIPHAFLFAGPKGTGKTSAARILAKVINCERSTVNSEPCGKCEQCESITNGTNIDVIEMDAASHRGIDDVRVLREAVKLAPAKANKKIYIIDEAHMLTTEASNALLKTLEEPPAHVVFVLATTNPEKLIDTIKSRTTLIQFKKATKEEIKNSLKRVISGEKIKINDEQLDKILIQANGGFRDAVKILEQFSVEGEKSFGVANDVDDFVDLFLNKDQEKLLATVDEIVKNGESIENFIKNILINLQAKLLEGKDVIKLVEILISTLNLMNDSPIEELPLQMAIINYCGKKMNNDSGSMNYEEKQETKEGKKSEMHKRSLANSEIHKSSFINHTSSSITNEQWSKILKSIKPVNASIEALLRSAHPEAYDGKVLSLNVYYKFHKERLEEIKNKKILEDVLAGVLGNITRVECNLKDPPVKIVNPPAGGETVLTENKDQDIIKVAEQLFSN